ncbi:hypothetical protein [Achromobacter sp. UMC71]|uniref:hypothetical protein n=1 Tax=Achromobacter sp. UMC71 TaxID=1862320 RepID=UPI0015FF7911|nr:hypothetical protein [Achromobacter sp. UMC71]MBB1625906.1 hypothetical protein [Achromobacter sp. UMC71]
MTVDGGIALTPDFIAHRLAALADAQSRENVRFRRLYGDAHWQRVRKGFTLANDPAASLDGAAGSTPAAG